MKHTDILNIDKLMTESTQTVNEVNPHNYDSDEDYYNALNAPTKPKHRGQSSPGVNPDDEAYFREIWRKNREAKAKHDGEQGVVEAGEWTKLPSGNWRNMHTGVQQSTPPKTKKPRRTMGLDASLEQHADDKMKELGHKFKGVAEDLSRRGFMGAAGAMAGGAVAAGLGVGLGQALEEPIKIDGHTYRKLQSFQVTPERLKKAELKNTPQGEVYTWVTQRKPGQFFYFYFPKSQVGKQGISEGIFGGLGGSAAGPMLAKGGPGYAGLSGAKKLRHDAYVELQMVDSLKHTNHNGYYDEEIKKKLLQAQEYLAKAKEIEQGLGEGILDSMGDEIKHGVKGIKRQLAGKPSRQDVKDKYRNKSIAARHAGDKEEADKNADRWARVHTKTNNAMIEQGVAEDMGAPANAGANDQRVTIIGGPKMYVGQSGWLGKMSPRDAQKYPGYVLVHLNHGGGSTMLPKSAVKIEQGVAEGNRGYFDGMPTDDNDYFRIPGPDAKPFNSSLPNTQPMEKEFARVQWTEAGKTKKSKVLPRIDADRIARKLSRKPDITKVYILPEQGVAEEASPLDRVRDRLGDQGYIGTRADRLRGQERNQEWLDRLHDRTMNHFDRSQDVDNAYHDSNIAYWNSQADKYKNQNGGSQSQRDSGSQSQRDPILDRAMNMFIDRMNRHQSSSQRDVDPEQLEKITNIKYKPGEEVEESLGRAVDSNGRTQQQWIQAVKSRFPNAQIMQSKMIDGPVQARVDDKTFVWNKVEQPVAEAGRAGFRAGNAQRVAVNDMSPEERKAHEDKRAEQQRKRDDARMERERQRNAAKKGVAEETTNNPEYSDEVGYVKDNLHTIVRIAKMLNNTMVKDENLPDWVQEKVAQAKGMLVASADYLKSQHEQGHVYTNNEEGLAEEEHEFKGANGRVSIVRKPGVTTVKRKDWKNRIPGQYGGGSPLRGNDMTSNDWDKKPRKSDYDNGDYSNDPFHEGVDYGAMYEAKLNEFASCGGTGGIATAPGIGKGPSVGSLFGGNYSQKNSPFKKTGKRSGKMIKR